MKQQHLVSSALAAALALGLGHSAQAQDGAKKEKCFGIAQAGANDCANLSGTHSCAGQAKTSMDANEWKYVPQGTCKNLKGLTLDEAKAKAGAKKS